MNEIFNIKRFGLILSKDFSEKWKKYILQFLTMFGIIKILFIWLSYSYYSDFGVGDYDYLKKTNFDLLLLASVLFLGFGLIFASTFMEPMQEKTKRISFLSIPASDFEKYISRWLIVTIGYIIAFFIALWIADAIRVAFFAYKYPKLNVQFLDLNKLVNPEGDFTRDYVFFSRQLFGLCLGDRKSVV
jgi:hypothetical protein